MGTPVVRGPEVSSPSTRVQSPPRPPWVDEFLEIMSAVMARNQESKS